MEKVVDEPVQVSREQAYKQYATGTKDTEQLRDVFNYVSSENMRLHGEQYKLEYFTGLKLPYENNEDLDLLAAQIRPELARRDKETFIENKAQYLIESSKETWIENLDELDLLEEKVNESIEIMRRFLFSQTNLIYRTIDKNLTADINSKWCLAYSSKSIHKKTPVVHFGLVGSNNKWHVDELGNRSGAWVQAYKSGKNVVRVCDSKYDAETYDLSISKFIKRIKVELKENGNTDYLDYLYAIIKFPELVKTNSANKVNTIKNKLGRLMGEVETEKVK